MNRADFEKEKAGFLEKANSQPYPIVRDVVQRFLRTSFRFELAGDAGNASSLTKFGGLPLAPPSFVWPAALQEIAPVFVGQVDLGELFDLDLPREGILYLFGQHDHPLSKNFIRSFTVVYSTYAKEYVTIPLPSSLKEYGTYFEESVNVIPQLSLPAYKCDTHISHILFSNDDEEETYTEVLRHALTINQSVILGGYPRSVQSYPPQEAMRNLQAGGHDFTPTEMDPANWQLLFEIDLMDDPWSFYLKELTLWEGGFNMGMDGRYFVIILKEDLKKLDFSRILTVYQMT